MIQYTLGKIQGNFSNDVNNNELATDRLFASERLDGHESTHLVVNHCTFTNMGFKKAKFTQIDFKHCVFINCYFKEAKFEDVNFTGCKFINCDFGSVTIIQCDFRFAKFEQCYVQHRNMKPNLPAEHNICRDLARNLSIQCVLLGDTEEFRNYYFEERKASEGYYWEVFLRREKFYKNKYGFWDGVSNFFKYISSKLSKLLWGYGESIRPLIGIMVSIIIFCSIVFWRYDGSFMSNNSVKHLTLGESVYYSISNFFGINANIQAVGSVLSWTLIESVMGVLLTGFLIAALFRFINRR